ncbi:MAG: response regulator [Telmatospirillum sp.]|nr:response regulator [Telmatospirillum sp.]
MVEDDELMRVSLEDRLLLEGFRVHSAATVDGARLLLQHGVHPGVVITDVRLPDGNGAQVFEMCRTRYPGLPVILMTAYVSVADAVRLVKAGALDYLEKPFKLEDLIETVRLAVEDHSGSDDKGLRGSVGNAERNAIVEALERCDWAISRTAEHLGISRKSLWEKMRRYQIER